MERRGIALFAGTEPAIIAESAASAEALGYRSFWLNHPGTTDGIAALAHAAEATSTIALGVGVVPLHLRAAADVVEAVRRATLPNERLLLGIGSAGPGAFALAREGVALLHSELGCSVFLGALGAPACRLAGRIADGVLLNWLTPEHARRSASWVKAGADARGRTAPELYAYVRVALGVGARTRIEEEGTRYQRGSYGEHFARMDAAPLETAIPAAGREELLAQLAHWSGVVDEVVLRCLPAAPTLDAHLELIRAGAP